MTGIPYVRRCKVGPIEVGDTERWERIRDWVASHGVDPVNVRPTIGMERTKTGWVLHVTEFVLQDGHKYVDLVTEECVTRPVRLPTGGPDTWPDGLVFGD